MRCESTAEFVLVTAYEEFEVAREAIGLGVFDYLVKPITIEDVMRVLERLSTKLGGTQEHMAGVVLFAINIRRRIRWSAKRCTSLRRAMPRS